MNEITLTPEELARLQAQAQEEAAKEETVHIAEVHPDHPVTA